MIGFFAAISLIGPAKTPLFYDVELIIATAAAYVLLGQVLTPEQFAGALVVVAALATAAASGLRANRAPGAVTLGTRTS